MSDQISKNAGDVRQAAKSGAKGSTQLHMRIAEIRDNTVVLKTGGLRSILKVSSLNFNLKSEEEQNAIIYSYQAFLNTLEFPIQILIRSRKLDLDSYIEKLRGIAEKQTNTLLQRQTYEYVDYIQRLIEYADIMEKEFYVVIPADPGRAIHQTFLQKFWGRMHPEESISEIIKRHQEFDNLKKNLTQRVSVVSGGLENVGLKVNMLNTSELIAMYYQIYNPITSRNEKVEDPSKTDLDSDEDMGH